MRCTFVSTVLAIFSSTGHVACETTTTTTVGPKNEIPPELEDLFAMFMRQAFLNHYANVIGVSSRLQTTLTPAERWVTDYVDEIKAASPTREAMLEDSEIKEKVRAIGRRINDAHGFEGMVTVCEYDRSYLRFIEATWDGIGRWMS
jgi:hypothetical protein